MHDHHHDHAHDHGSGHHHPQPPADFSAAFVIAIALNSAFVVIEFSYGFITNSTALMADAGHNLSDVLGLLLAWGATVLGKTRPSGRYTYGLRSSSILAALANATLLLVACGAIAWEAVRRVLEPPEVAGMTVAIVAGIGIVVNGISAWLFMSGNKNDLNVRGAFLHMATDALVSAGVVIGGVTILFTGWNWLDPVISLVIVAVIMAGTWGLLRDSLRLSLSAVPAQINLPAVEHFLQSLPGVAEVTDLHVWGMSTTENALTAHLLMPVAPRDDRFLEDVAQALEQEFSIHHCTLQIRHHATAHGCSLVRAD
ncbi:MAG: cation transporter [Herminiimonas sp.]|nr:cation transporter [Herminiimonas sp.]